MYVPVMKNRTVEVGVLQQLSAIGVFDDNVIPLIELVQKKTRNNNKNNEIAYYNGCDSRVYNSVDASV